MARAPAKANPAKPAASRDDGLDMQTHALATEVRVVMARLRQRIRGAPPSGLTGPQLIVLSLLEREGAATVTTLASSEGMRPQSMGATVTTLEAAGFVTRAPDPADGRQSIVSLTPASRKLIKAYRDRRQDWLMRAIQSQLSPVEQVKLERGLAIMKQIVE